MKPRYELHGQSLSKNLDKSQKSNGDPGHDTGSERLLYCSLGVTPVQRELRTMYTSNRETVATNLKQEQVSSITVHENSGASRLYNLDNTS